MKKRTQPYQKEKWINSLQLPKDVCMGALRVTLTGNSEVWIENYRGILEYTGERILFKPGPARYVWKEADFPSTIIPMKT